MSKLLNFTYNSDAIYEPAMAGIAKAFAEYKHDPSPDHWEGISEIVKAIEGMATGLHTWKGIKEEPIPPFKDTFYISSLAPGMGKTTALIETVRAIMNHSDPMYQDISFIIFLSRLTEIAALVERIGLDEKEYSVIVSPDEEVFQKGNQNKKAARVLFTTQQMLEVRCHDGNKLRKFSEIGDFFYNGKPRQVRVWDEAILPSRIMTLQLDELMALPNDITNVDLAAVIRDFCKILLSAKDGDLIDAPDLSEYEELLGGFETLQDLRAIDGRAVRVVIDNRKKTTALQYADILPDDLSPMLILDASGEQRTTYEWWKESRGNLQPLYSPPKSYAGLTVHHWDRGSGRNTLSKKKADWKDIVEGTLLTIEGLPKDEEVLVIYLKPDKNSVDIQEEIQRELTPKDKGRIKFLTWGRHTATNEFKDIKYVILTSLWYYSPADYEGNVYGAKNQSVDIPATKEEKKRSAEGEHKHHILQATCRGRVRYAKGDRCPDGCHLYLVYSHNQGLGEEDFIQQIFPQCVHEEWRPLWKLRGVKAKIVDHIFSTKGHFVSINGICRHLNKRRDNVWRYLKDPNDEVRAYIRDKKGWELEYHLSTDKDTGFLIHKGISKPF